MSWPIVAFGLLGVALVAGFAWYEHSRPSSRVLALVGTLAALAVLGRVAFAPLPNVKPTTDIVLLSGYVLGGAPGFVVGAVAGLVSNFFFGQGPWTPWEMLAWGGVGIAGALVGRLSGRALPRLPLALVCALAGLAYGVVLDFASWVNYTGGDTNGTLGAVLVLGVPFNIAHAAGNFVFCLAFGPALVRAVSRFRDRFDVDWKSAAQTGAPILVVAVLGAGLVLAPAARAATPSDYLRTAQNADGGFGGSSGASSTQLYTGWAALGLAAAGHNPAAVSRHGKSIIDYIRAGARSLNDVGEIERTILVVHTAGLDPRHFAGRDLVGALSGNRKRDGSVGGLVNLTAFAILAYRAAGESPNGATVRNAASWLAGQQNGDGGFGFAKLGTPSDIDNTGAVIQALAAGGRARGQIRHAVAFLRGRQNRDGGFPLNPGGASNAQSTAWAVQGLVAAGRDPDGLRAGGRSARAYLKSLTAANGAVRYSRTSQQTPVWVTGQAIPALAAKALPLPSVPRAAPSAAARPPVTARVPSAAHHAATPGRPHPHHTKSATSAGPPVAAPDGISATSSGYAYLAGRLLALLL